MKDITIDCGAFLLPSDLHQAFTDTLVFPEYYGNNLDALHDCLTDLAEETKLRLLNWTGTEIALGNYARSVKRVILDAAIDNPNLTVLFD